MLLERIIHKGRKRIAINLPNDEATTDKIRSIRNRLWSSSLGIWHVPDTSGTIKQIKDLFPEYILNKRGDTELNNTPDFWIRHNEKDSLLYIKNPYKYKNIVRKAKKVRWDTSHKLFVVEASDENIKQLLLDLEIEDISYKYEKNDFSIIKKKRLSPIDTLPKINHEKATELERLQEWMIQKRYAVSTISDYKSCLSVFFRFYSEKAIKEINVKDIEYFNYDFIIGNQYSEKTQNQYISAIKTFYVKMHGINHEINDIERPISGRKLPKIIAKANIRKILQGITNTKHRMALSLIYSLGLRRSELINLKVSEVDFVRNTVEIINSKGKRDRVLPLSKKLKPKLISYLEQYKPKTYFIEGQKEGMRYSSTSISNIFSSNVEKVIKNHKFTPHSLRHSYATHLLDSGVDLRYIQELLGHKSSKTTEIYTHVSMKNLRDIRNPFDDFDL